ncbi:hypothetical protein LTR86_003381 [Recurvomyces mirabilis]|nr:hypothetical protein LTR86_003381 [Recurvomyces mirabilis]
MSRTSHLPGALNESLFLRTTKTEYASPPDHGVHEPILNASDRAELDNFWKQVPGSGVKEDAPPSGPYQADSSLPYWCHRGYGYRSPQPRYDDSEPSSTQRSMPDAFASETPPPVDPFTPSSLTSRTATMEEIQQLRASVEKREAQEKREALEKFRSREQRTYHERYQAEKEAAERKAAAAEEKRKQEDLRLATVRLAKMVLQDGLAVRRSGRLLSQLRKEAGEKTSADASKKIEARGSETGEVVSSGPIEEPVRDTLRRPTTGCNAQTTAKLGSAGPASLSLLEEKTLQKPSDQPPRTTKQASGISKLWTLARERQLDIRDSRDWIQVEGEEDFVAVGKDELMGDIAEEMSGEGKEMKWQVVSNDGEDVADESEWEMDMT